MRIVTNDRGNWSVMATWMGCEREVFRGDIFECIAFTLKVSDE